MPWDIDTTIYELKGNLSRFLRALSRGDADFVVVKRYNRTVALIIPTTNRDIPAFEPQTPEDRQMRARAVWRAPLKDDSFSRRPPPISKSP